MELDRLNELRALNERVHGGELTGTGILEMAAGIHELLRYVDELNGQLDAALDELDTIRPMAEEVRRHWDPSA